MKKKVIAHLKGDIKTFKKEAAEDKELIKKLSKPKKSAKKAVKKVVKKASKKAPKRATKAAKKIKRVMHEFKEHALHSGSKKGPKVRKRKQAIAIALSEADRSLKKK